MKILLITGSPHRNGTGAVLAEQFIRGAAEAGHQVYRFDAAFKNIHPCTACDSCRSGEAGCLFKDDMEELNSALFSAETVVFVSPIYYCTFSAQLKTVIDRFYANDEILHGDKKAILLTTMADETPETAEGANAAFLGMTEYLGWEPLAVLNAAASGDTEALNKTDYPVKAYELGKSL